MSAAGGEWNVPSDQVAMVHKNESIIPAAVATPMREFFSTGGKAKVEANQSVSTSVSAAPPATATATATNQVSANAQRDTANLESIKLNTENTAKAIAEFNGRDKDRNSFLGKLKSGFISRLTGGLISSAGGEWDVDQDRLNLVHKNETILPATIAAPMREFFSNGGLGNLRLPDNAMGTGNASAGLAITAASALAVQQTMMQAQQKQQTRNTGGSVVINTKGGDFVHKDDIARMLKNDNRNFRIMK